MGRRITTLPKPRTRYYVDEPDMMLSIGEYEQTIEHLTKMGLIDSYPETEQRLLRQRHALFMRAMRAKLAKAKSHYNIKT